MTKLKTSLLFIGLIIITALFPSPSWTNNTYIEDGGSIIVKQGNTYGGTDKSSSIEATIDGHTLTVVFLENLGQVAVNVTDVTGYNVEALSIFTPNGVIFYIPNTGTYIVHFTLPNGDTYYGEFEVTD